jgi:hypothetical protein
MRFHAITMTFQSADIVAQSIHHTLSWADALYICDTGSTDGTWEIIQQEAARDSRIMASRWKPIVFHEGVRSLIFEQYRKYAEEGDWFAKADEDEFYHVPPPEFIRTACAPHESSVWGQCLEFRLTTADVARLEGSGAIEADRARPLAERLRHYVPLRYCEPRMFRYRRSMTWLPDCAFPFNAGYTARRRIPMRHYPHRDPLQLQQRIDWRQRLLELLPPGTYAHWKAQSWQDFVLPADSPELCYWKPGEPLPHHNEDASHLAPPVKRLGMRLAHRFLLPILDASRPAYPSDYHPQLVEIPNA